MLAIAAAGDDAAGGDDAANEDNAAVNEAAGSAAEAPLVIVSKFLLKALHCGVSPCKRGFSVRIKSLLEVTASKVYVTAAKQNYNYLKIKTAERVSTVRREWIKTEERIKID
ncbi:hypothetical protein Tco_0704406 [Tanacetum coccineum]|uniref:Uncharacterized protein n=1 Tax=Tanacetum coccineum TaxID=301880 RepID=A0ABQ4Y1I8_9ASTR